MKKFAVELGTTTTAEKGRGMGEKMGRNKYLGCNHIYLDRCILNIYSYSL